MNRVLAAAVVVVGALLSAAWSDPALADRRVALVIGNAAYQNAPPLRTPVNDAKAMSAKLEEAGFVLIARPDLGYLPFKRAIRDFEDLARDADVAVVFYAGHGIEIRGVNFLVPVDAKLASDRDAEDEAISLDRLLQAVEPAKRMGLVILDAQRDNPFARTMKRSRATAAAVSPGLDRVEPTNGHTLVAYAAKAGNVAKDGTGQSGPYTAALLKHLFVPGLDVRLAFGRIRDDIFTSTNRQQEPWVYGSLGGSNVSLVPAPAQPAVATPVQEQRIDYELVQTIDTKRAFEVFLSQHPTGFYSDLAREQLAKVIAREQAAEAAAKPAREAALNSADASRGAAAIAAESEQNRTIRALFGRGRSYALIIGNKDYRDTGFSRLKTPHEDARSIANILRTQYGFMTELILRDGSRKSLLLLDRPARELFSLLDDLEERMSADDRLLIFYAGHGHLDGRTGKAYWIPVEAANNRRSEWISADYIVSALKGIKARSVLVVADSCFSGALFRTSPDPDPSEAEFAYSLVKDAERSSRVLIASGGTEPVLDGGADGHSIFARKFLDALVNPIRPIFSARELHVRRLKPSVSGNVQQVPQYDWLRESGHDAGDFVFVRTGQSQSAAPR